MRSFEAMSSLGERKPNVKQACMRPCTSDGLPVMGAVPGVEGAYISTAHNCWGILWAPICGKAMTELVLHGKSSSVDLRPFSPARYMQPIKGRGKKLGGVVGVGEQW